MDLLLYIVVAGAYIMTIHFAVAAKTQFQLFLFLATFVLGGAIGHMMGSYETGLVLAIILSLVFF